MSLLARNLTRLGNLLRSFRAVAGKDFSRTLQRGFLSNLNVNRPDRVLLIIIIVVISNRLVLMASILMEDTNDRRIFLTFTRL